MSQLKMDDQQKVFLVGHVSDLTTVLSSLSFFPSTNNFFFRQIKPLSVTRAFSSAERRYVTGKMVTILLKPTGKSIYSW